MRTFIIAVVALFVSGLAYGQASPRIAVSKEKVKVNGEIMYVHKVKAKETLYSIAKAYNIAIDDIVRKNESLKAGLKEGITIYIPSKGSAIAAAKETPETPQANAGQAQDWELNKENIKKYSQKKHTVKWYEQLADVAAKYNVPAEAIAAFNNLKDTQLKKKQVLYIPNNEFLLLQETRKQALLDVEKESDDFKDEVTQKEDGTVVYEYSSGLSEENAELKRYNITLDTYAGKGEDSARIAYILPLGITDTLGANSNFMDFYAGALLAANAMKEQGMALDIELIDQRMYGSVSEIIAGKKIDESFNFIVGPVRSQDMAIFLKEFYEGGYTPYKWHKTNIISPMDMAAEQLVEDNEMFIQAPASQKSQMHNLVKMFAGKCSHQNNAIVIYEKGGSDAVLVKETIGLLDSLGINYTQISYGILEGREILSRLMPHFKPQMENLVLVPSNSEAFVSDVVRNMNLLHTNPIEENKRQVTLFGTPRWRNFETIEVDYFHRMNLHLSLPYFVDYSNADVKDFLMKYRALYNGEPTPFAFQGYDITRYFLTLHKKYGNKFNRAYELGETRMLQSNFNLVQNNSSQLNGFENTGTVNIMYNNDYTISVLE